MHLVLESYITHCKVIEDAASPSGPPALDAPIDQKKVRVIIVAVRKSGRVRMHKARENQNGSFQIGKTWNLDDLQEIENYIAPNEKGFTVTILKPYYWQAQSGKEKDFFISSMLKIFKKYTGGKIPNLIGFERTDIDRILDGAASIQVKQRQEGEGSRASTPPTPSLLTPNMTLKPLSLRNLTTAQSMDSLTMSTSRQLSPGIKGMDGLSAPASVLRPSQSSDRLPRRVPDPLALGRTTSSKSTASNDSVPPPIPPGRRPSDGSQRSGRQRSRPPQEDRAVRRTPSVEPSADKMRRTPSSNSQQPREAPPVEYQPFNSSSSTPRTLAHPTDSDLAGRTLQSRRSNKDVGSAFRLAPATLQAANPNLRPQTPTTPGTPSASMFRSPSREHSRELEKPPELPQIKFPRDQGAANGRVEESEDRRSRSRDPLPSVAQKSPSPVEKIDPPPKSARRATLTSRENNIPALLNQKPKAQDSSPGPRNQHTLDIPVTMGQGTPSLDQSTLDPGNERTPRSRSRSPNTKARKRKSTKSSYLDDVDTSRVTVDLEELLHEFNWDGRGKVDELETSIKKEIATVESSNIIIHSDGDMRVDDLSALLDKAIRECEEMDALLTLYAVELTVCCIIVSLLAVVVAYIISRV